MVEINRFYVYVHCKPKCGTVFYVGLGSNKRAWQSYGRNKHWHAIKKKHGISIELCQEGLDRKQACLLEQWLIAKLRHSGIVLSNVTAGGDGGTGVVVPREQRIRLSRLRGGKSVYCSDGRRFDSASSAAKILSEELKRPCFPAGIISCCKGKGVSAYGLRWSYHSVPNGNFLIGSDNICVRVCSSDGMKFKSASEAAIYTSSRLGRSVDPSSILKASKSKKGTAYGLSWALGEDVEKALMKVEDAPVLVRSDGKTYTSVREASEDIYAQGLSKSQNSARAAIFYSMGRENGTAYGFSWKMS